ncbi:MAG: helix-turn-helix domain-containing protein [Saccharofermentanales bacterium]
MKIGDQEVDLTDEELELLELVHPLFRGLTFREAAKELGVHRNTVINRLRQLKKKFPALEDTMKKWDNPDRITWKKLTRAMPLSQQVNERANPKKLEMSDTLGTDMKLQWDPKHIHRVKRVW